VLGAAREVRATAPLTAASGAGRSASRSQNDGSGGAVPPNCSARPISRNSAAKLCNSPFYQERTIPGRHRINDDRCRIGIMSHSATDSENDLEAAESQRVHSRPTCGQLGAISGGLIRAHRRTE
jgi:hypothetical protein